MPISTGMQLVTTSLFGVIVFHEWSTTTTVILGVLALIFIVIGIVLTSLESEKMQSNLDNSKRDYYPYCFNNWILSVCSCRSFI